MEMAWYEVVGWILYYITLPIVWVLLLLLNIVRFVLSPFIYIGYLVKEVCAWPFRVLAKFEPVWYFVGSAVLIGILFALSIIGVVRLFTVFFDLDRKPVPRDKPAKGHSPATYRAAREEKKRKAQEKEKNQALRAELLASHPLIQQVVKEARARPISDSSPLSPNTSTPASRSGLLRTTILEHSDEEVDSAF